MSPDSEPLVRFLAGTDLLAELPLAVLEPVARSLLRVAYPAGATVFSEGECGDAAFFVEQGSVCLLVGGAELLTCRRGECLGEFALVDEGPRSATALATTDLVLLRWARVDFHAALTTSPQISRAVFRLLTNKLRGEVAMRMRMLSERERVAQDLERAREMQTGMLPPQHFRGRGLDIAALCQPAQEVGGDFIDYLPAPDGSVLLVIADVTGHGFYAALLVAMAKSALHARDADDRSPEAVVRALRGCLALVPGGGLMMSCCCLRVDRAAGEVEYANAGHPAPLLWRARERTLCELRSMDPLLGALDEDDSVSTARTSIAAGDLLLLYSDGITEAEGADGMFGVSRLREVVAARAPATAPTQLVHMLLDALRGHLAGATAEDDLALLVARCTD